MSGVSIMTKSAEHEHQNRCLRFANSLSLLVSLLCSPSILETGFFHADPHPGNIFVLDDGKIGLIDFGQVKQISKNSRVTLAKVMVALDERRKKGADLSEYDKDDIDTVSRLSLDLGVTLKEGAPLEAAAAVGMWLFDGSVKELPGGYDLGELSPNSPVKEVSNERRKFPILSCK